MASRSSGATSAKAATAAATLLHVGAPKPRTRSVNSAWAVALKLRSVARLFVRSASMAGSILFIVAAASSLSFALTIEQIPQLVSGAMIAFAQDYGSTAFLLVAVVMMVVFGAILEGAPALIIFGPLLTPIAQQLGIHPLHFGTVMVIAMGLGLFAPPIGLGLFATCAITGTEVRSK